MIARSAGAAAMLMRDAEPIAPQGAGHWTFYRFVFPVEQESKP
jgi:hypothetical protein